MTLGKNILLVGASQMAVDYYRVLFAMGHEVVVVGRSEDSAQEFQSKTQHPVTIGGIQRYCEEQKDVKFHAAIVAVGMEQIYSTTIALLHFGIRHILIEKPGGMNADEISKLSHEAKRLNAEIYVAYNRRFYSSIKKAKEIILEDGGVESFHFEFTELAHKIEGLVKKEGIKEAWFLGNSTHVVDLAFYLGGKPTILHALAEGSLSWHPKSNFVGSGKSKNGALFTYHANWAAPGRWVVEVITKHHRLLFKPLEKLKVQRKGSMEIEDIVLEDEMDKSFKPGLFKQVEAFLNRDYQHMKSIEEQKSDMVIYDTIIRGN